MAGLGIVNDDLFNSELEIMTGVGRPKHPDALPPSLNPESPIQAEIVEINPGGRGSNKETPEGLRQLIGENYLEEGRGASKELAAFLGVSDSSLSAYSAGATSTATINTPDTKLKTFLTDKRQKIAKKASKVLTRAMEGITDDKLSEASARELSGIAKDMAVIIKDMLPEEKTNARDGDVNKNIHYVMFAPPMAKESKFDVVQVIE